MNKLCALPLIYFIGLHKSYDSWHLSPIPQYIALSFPMCLIDDQTQVCFGERVNKGTNDNNNNNNTNSSYHQQRWLNEKTNGVLIAFIAQRQSPRP